MNYADIMTGEMDVLFPSITDREDVGCRSVMKSDDPRNPNGVYWIIHVDVMKEHLFDKQRVREVLERMLKPTFVEPDHSMAAYNQVFKELGL